MRREDTMKLDKILIPLDGLMRLTESQATAAAVA
jgi:hypothetical protein